MFVHLCHFRILIAQQEFERAILMRLENRMHDRVYLEMKCSQPVSSSPKHPKIASIDFENS